MKKRLRPARFVARAPKLGTEVSQEGIVVSAAEALAERAPAPTLASIALPARLDRRSARNAAVAVMRRCRRHGPGAITMDLSAVRECDRAGVRVLVECRRRAAAHGTCLILVGPTTAAIDALGRAGVLASFRLGEADLGAGSSVQRFIADAARRRR
jgi:anti-anti-sigma regulatory factor